MRAKWTFLSLFVLVVIMLLTLSVHGHMHGSMRGRFQSIGEQIYYTGIGSSGYYIPFHGGPMWLRMHGGGCFSCHGIHGRGGVPVMMRTALPTDIRYKALIGEEKHVHGGDENKHDYTDELIKRASPMEQARTVSFWIGPCRAGSCRKPI